MSLTFRTSLLKCLAFALLIGPGIIMVLAPVTPLISWVNGFLDLAHQPMDGDAITGNAAFLLNAILGGILIGFGTMIWVTAEHVFKNNLELGRKLIGIPLVCWFLTDSTGSILAGAWFNAVLNAAFFAMFCVPLFWGRKPA